MTMTDNPNLLLLALVGFDGVQDVGRGPGLTRAHLGSDRDRASATACGLVQVRVRVRVWVSG